MSNAQFEEVTAVKAKYQEMTKKLIAEGCKDEDIISILKSFEDKIVDIYKVLMPLFENGTNGMNISKMPTLIQQMEDIVDSELGSLNFYINSHHNK